MDTTEITCIACGCKVFTQVETQYTRVDGLKRSYCHSGVPGIKYSCVQCGEEPDRDNSMALREITRSGRDERSEP